MIRAIKYQNKALELIPNHSQLKSNLKNRIKNLKLVCRGLMNNGKTKRAAELCWLRVEQSPEDERDWLEMSPIIALVDNKVRYSEFCKRMVKKFGGTNDVVVAERVCKSCLLLPGAIDVEELPGDLLDSKLDASKLDEGAVGA